MKQQPIKSAQLFCRCDQKYYANYELGVHVCLDASLIDRPSNKKLHKCPVCFYYPWFDPNYENMMHDLKEMNSM